MPSPTPARLPSASEVRSAYREELESGAQAAVLSWTSFTTTFAAVRAVTYGIRNGVGPMRNLNVGGEHLHHYMWGIAMVAGVGGVAVRGSEAARRHPSVALVYGAGLALIVDEFALLIDLKDVYWAKEGRLSVDIGVGVVALGGTAVAAAPVLRRLLRDRRS
jgi:hypothetical protein